MAKYSATHRIDVKDGKVIEDKVWLNYEDGYGSMFIETKYIPEVVKKLQEVYDLAQKVGVTVRK